MRTVALASVVLCLLSACASDQVVTEPLAFPDVKKELMSAKRPVCPVPAIRTNAATGRVGYDGGELKAWGECNDAAVNAVYARLTGLQRAVRVRQQAAAKAIAAKGKG